MSPHIDYDVDVEGDVILTLEKPNQPFAVWSGEDELLELPQSLQPVLADEVLRDFRRTDPAWKEPLVPGNSVRSHGFEVDPPLDPEGVMAEQTGLGDEEAMGGEVSPIRLRLSSRHLISASPYFRAHLTGPRTESASRAGGRYEISATEWDENAFKLLMDVIHGNSQNVPRSINLEPLAKVAVLVDYYKCHNVVKFYSDTWIEGLGKMVNANLYSKELPFPEGLIEEIDRVRARSVGVLLDGMHDLLRYLTTRDSCEEACSAVLVGTLYREMSARGILNPRPAPPFEGFSIAGVVLMAWNLKSRPV